MKTKHFILVALLGLAACNGNSTAPLPEAPISISTPSNGATLLDPPNITVIPGTGFTFTRVDFYIDSLLVSSDSIAPFQFRWNIFAYQSGTNHSIYAIGTTTDTSYTTDQIHVTVQFTRGFSFISVYRPGSQHALGVTSYYNVLFISVGDFGLEVLDISAKSQPLFRSRLDTPGQATHSAVEFPNVYIADRNQGVTMANFQNVDSLLPTHIFSSQSQVNDVAVSDNFILAVENDGLSILAQSNLSPFSRQAVQDHLNYIVARHDTAFMVGNGSFYVVDCTHSNASQIVGIYGNNLGQGKAVAVTDTFAFIANGTDGIIALSIANPANPRFLARYNPSQDEMTTVATGNGLLFAGSHTSKVYALDYTSRPDSIQTVDIFTVGNLVEEIALDNNYVYVAANTDVDILRFVP
jgi:hypothetical protein